MKKEVKHIFDDIQNEFDRYASTTNDIFARYRKQVDQAKAQCSKYKDEIGELRKAKESLAAPARREIEAADQKLHDQVTGYCKALRAALSEHICTSPAAGFVQTLRNYKDFGLSPSRFELDALIIQAGGSYQGLRLLQAVTSKYKLNFPQAEDYEADLTRIERAARTPVLYEPSGYAEEAHEILPNARRYLPNGESYDAGRPTAVYLAMRCAGIQSDRDALAPMADRWTSNFVPNITEYEEIKTEGGEVITPAHQHAEAVKTAAESVGVTADGDVARAHEMGRQRAEAMSRNLDHFTK